jgi:hypothetical protein
MLTRIRHLPLLFVGIAILGLMLGFKLEPWVGWRTKKPQVVLLGSGNVQPFLRTNIPASVWAKIDSLWINEGSGDALVNAFSVFNFGNSVNVDSKIESASSLCPLMEQRPCRPILRSIH